MIACVYIITIITFLVAGLFAVPKFFGIKVFAVASESMQPFYSVGSLVFIVETPLEHINAGDCITYESGNKIVTHRVVNVDSANKIFVTKGDSNKEKDPPVSFNTVLGKTAGFAVPLIGYVAIWLNKANLEPVLYFLVAAGVIVLMLDIMTLRWERKSK